MFYLYPINEYIHPSIAYTAYTVGVKGKLQPIQADFRQEGKLEEPVDMKLWEEDKTQQIRYRKSL